MKKSKLNKIIKKINELKIIKYEENPIKSDTNFIKIIKGTYYLNNSHSIIRESVIKNNGNTNAVVVVALTSKNNILIVIEPRAALPTETKMSIELPAGYIDDCESSLDAAKRELEEETGYAASKYILLDSYYPSLGASSERIDLVLACNCIHNSKQHLDSDEYVNYEEVTIEEFRYLIDNGYILDASSRIGYYRLLEYINNRSDLDEE